MGLFTKKSSTHFERDEKGKVVNITHTDEQTRDSDRLIKQYQEEKRKQTPSRWDQWKAKRAQEKQVYQKTYEKQKTRAIEARAKRIANERYNPKPGSRQPMFTWSSSGPPSKGNANPFGSLFDFGVSAAPKPKSVKKSQKYVIRGGKAYPIAGTNSNKKKTSSKKKSSSGGYDMMDNWGFFK